MVIVVVSKADIQTVGDGAMVEHLPEAPKLCNAFSPL
jgi:hypothetical protein